MGRAKMKFLIVLAVLIAAAMAEETKVAEVTDQQVAASGYFGYGHLSGYHGHGLGYGHHGGYYGHPGSYYGHGYGRGHRYGRSVSDDVQGHESHSGSYVRYNDVYGGYGYSNYGYY